MNYRLEFLHAAFESNRDTEKSRQFQAYLKTEQAMFGLPAPLRKNCLKQCLKTFPISEQADYLQFVSSLWHQTEREFQYCAIDTAVKYKKFHNDQSWATFKSLALTAKWWDLVDGIAVNLIGSLLKQNRQYQSQLDIWALDSDLWVRRTALLAHLKHKDQTDLSALSQTILVLCPDTQFFIQKAIGWSLREYAKTDANWTLDFIDRHHEKLTKLAVREASKHLGS